MYDYESIASEYGYSVSLCVRMFSHVAQSSECDDMRISEAVEKLKPFFLQTTIDTARAVVRELNKL